MHFSQSICPFSTLVLVRIAVCREKPRGAAPRMKIKRSKHNLEFGSCVRGGGNKFLGLLRLLRDFFSACKWHWEQANFSPCFSVWEFWVFFFVGRTWVALADRFRREQERATVLHLVAIVAIAGGESVRGFGLRHIGHSFRKFSSHETKNCSKIFSLLFLFPRFTAEHFLTHLTFLFKITESLLYFLV